MLYSTDVVGSAKAVAAADRIRAFNPDIEFEVSDQRLSSAVEVTAAIEQARPDFVSVWPTNPTATSTSGSTRPVLRRGIPYAAASVSAQLGTAYSVLPGHGPCYQCRVDSEIAAAPELQEPLDYVRGNEVNASNAALGPACMFWPTSSAMSYL